MCETARIVAFPNSESRPKFGAAEALVQRLREIRAMAGGTIDDAELHEKVVTL